MIQWTQPNTSQTALFCLRALLAPYFLQLWWKNLNANRKDLLCLSLTKAGDSPRILLLPYSAHPIPQASPLKRVLHPSKPNLCSQLGMESPALSLAHHQTSGGFYLSRSCQQLLPQVGDVFRMPMSKTWWRTKHWLLREEWEMMGLLCLPVPGCCQLSFGTGQREGHSDTIRRCFCSFPALLAGFPAGSHTIRARRTHSSNRRKRARKFSRNEEVWGGAKLLTPVVPTPDRTVFDIRSLGTSLGDLTNYSLQFLEGKKNNKKPLPLGHATHPTYRNHLSFIW